MKIRIISGIVALLVVLPIVYIGEMLFTVAVTLFGLIALFEMFRLRKAYKEVPVVVQGIAYIMLTFIIMSNVFIDYHFAYQFGISELAIVLFVLFAPIVFFRNIKLYSVNDASYLLLALLYIGIPFNYLIVVRNYHLNLLVYVALIAVITDTMAYFTGVFFGRHKLIPEISPKKTIEGSVGGTVFAVVLGTLFLKYTNVLPDLPLITLVLMSLVLSILGQIGDLVASAMKRRYEIKDFGNILPGHGGVLDRLDNIMFVVAGLVVFIDLFTNIALGV